MKKIPGQARTVKAALKWVPKNLFRQIAGRIWNSADMLNGGQA